MTTYKQFIPVAQPKGCNIQYAVNRDECADVPACSMTEYAELIGRCEASTENQQRNLYCSAFLLGYMSADAFWAEIKATGLWAPQESFLKAYATGVLALAAEQQNGSVRLPEPQEKGRAA